MNSLFAIVFWIVMAVWALVLTGVIKNVNTTWLPWIAVAILGLFVIGTGFHYSP